MGWTPWQIPPKEGGAPAGVPWSPRGARQRGTGGSPLPPGWVPSSSTVATAHAVTEQGGVGQKRERVLRLGHMAQEGGGSHQSPHIAAGCPQTPRPPWPSLGHLGIWTASGAAEEEEEGRWEPAWALGIPLRCCPEARRAGTPPRVNVPGLSATPELADSYGLKQTRRLCMRG